MPRVHDCMDAGGRAAPGAVAEGRTGAACAPHVYFICGVPSLRTPLRRSAQGPFFAPAFPASLERPGRPVRGARARRGGDSPDPRLLSGSPLALARTRALLRFALRALACKSCACLPALRFPVALGRPGQTLRGLPVRRAKGPLDPWQVSGSPMASPFSRAKVHRTFALIRFTALVPRRAWAAAAPLTRLE